MELNYDIVVVGASTTGAYYARKMAEQGFRVLVIEKESRESISRGYDIVHIGVKEMEAHGLPKPVPGDGVYEFEYEDAAMWSPYYRHPKRFKHPTMGMHKHGLVLKLIDWAQEAGAEFRFQAPFRSVQVKGKNTVVGIKYSDGGEEVTVRARLVVDASGRRAVVRTALPKQVGVETFRLTRRDVFFVTLRYIRFKDRKRWMTNHNWLAYKMWLAPSDSEYDAILGIGACLSYEQGEAYYQQFMENVAPSLPPFEVCKIERWPTPYHRSLYSYVGNGFLVLGDAAIIHRSDNGEGIGVALNHTDIAVDVTSRLMKAGKPMTRRNMWPINYRYNRGQGRELAAILAVLAKALSLSPDTLEYMFLNDCLMSQAILAEQGKDITMGELLMEGRGVIRGVREGSIPWNELKPVMAGGVRAAGLWQRYSLYPRDPARFPAWVRLTQRLWNKVGQMADLYEDPEE